MRRIASVSLLAFVLPATICLGSAAYGQAVGEATRVQVFAYQTPPQAARAPLYRLNPVLRNATLQTVPNGALEVTFADGSKLTLGSSSTVVVDNYVYAQGGVGAQALKMSRGVFRFVSGSIPKDQVKLHTPTVTIGIRGTTVKGKINDDDSQTIFFEHGEGGVTNPATGQSVDMKQGDMVKVGPDGTIGTPQNTSWLAGDAAVDDGMNPFNRSDSGPDAGSTGGDGAGAAGGVSGGD
jgi:hypothetical protein